MTDEPLDAELAGLPPAAVERVRHQRSSGVRGSLLSAPAAAAIRSAGLEPVGEVFGCIVMSFGWSGGACGYGYGWNTTFAGGGPVGGWGWTSGGVPGTVGGGIAGGTSANRGSGPGFRTAPFGGNRTGVVSGYGIVTPVVVSGDAAASRFAWGRSRAEAVEHALAEAHRRMLAEAGALGADGVLGITRSVTPLGAGVEEYATLGTAVRYVDPALTRRPGATPWAATLTGEDVAAAATSGFRPSGVAFGYSLALKHEDWQLRQQRSTWTNQEVDGLTELLGAARADARHSLAREARRAAAAGGEVVVTANSLRTFERTCTGETKDVLAEALFVGTVLTPHPAGSTRRRTLTVLPLTPPTAPATRRGR
jgi:uncharacterized protein YbjQ (UPF0145 family)